MMDNDDAWMYYHDQVVEKIDLNFMLRATEKICSALGFRLGQVNPQVSVDYRAVKAERKEQYIV